MPLFLYFLYTIIYNISELKIGFSTINTFCLDYPFFISLQRKPNGEKGKVMQKEKENYDVVKYDVDGQEITLTKETVKNYLVGSDAKITDQEFYLFATMCKARGLNPFVKEAYLIKYGDKPAQIVVSKDVLLKRASQHPDFDGIEDGIVVIDKDGNEQFVEGRYLPQNTTLVGGWARVYRKNLSKPKFVSVSMTEFCKTDKYNKPISSWAIMPSTMINKVAQATALREAFPVEFSGLYDEAEFGASDKSVKEPEVAPEVSNTEMVVDSDTGEVIDVDVKPVDDELKSTMATENQIEQIKKLVGKNRKLAETLMKHYNFTKFSELNVVDADQIISYLRKK